MKGDVPISKSELKQASDYDLKRLVAKKETPTRSSPPAHDLR